MNSARRRPFCTGASSPTCIPTAACPSGCPSELAHDALANGWALAHPLAGVWLSAGLALLPAPRDGAKREIVTAVVGAVRRHAAAETADRGHGDPVTG